MGGSQKDRAAGDLDVVLEHLYSLTERDDPRIGEVIDGRYQLVRALGSGGMGQVYVARHEALGRDVAVKILPVSGASAYREERFRREALAAARLSSPHVVSVFDFVTLPAGGLAIVMELLEGEDLAACLDREGPPPIDRALHVMRSVAEALDHAHSRGVVHRDLKPENVFLARDERGVLVVKVLDFGVARMLEPGTTSSDHALTEAGTALGTPARPHMAVSTVIITTMPSRASITGGASAIVRLMCSPIDIARGRVGVAASALSAGRGVSVDMGGRL